jgi:outer membrane protein TolC
MKQDSFHKLFGVLTLSALLTSPAAAVLTWDQAASEALAHNPSLASSRLAVEEAGEGVTIASAGLWPALSASAGLSRSGAGFLYQTNGQPDLSQGLGRESDSTGYDLGLGANWQLFNGFATLYNRLSAEERVRQSEASYTLSSAALRLSLRRSFNQLLYDQKNQQTLQAISQRLHKDTKYLYLKYKSGQEAHWSYAQAESDEAEINWEIQQGLLNLQADQANLAGLLGREPAKAGGLEVAGRLTIPEPPSSDQAVLAQVEEDHPSLIQQRSFVSAARDALRQAQASRYPTLSANGGATMSGGNTWPATAGSWSAGLSLNYDLFQGFGPEASIRQAKQALEASQQALDLALFSVESGLHDAWAQYRSAWLRLPQVEMSLKVGEERFRTVERLYQSGMAAFLDYEQAQSGYTNSQQSQLSADLSAAQSLAQYENALGKGLEEK